MDLIERSKLLVELKRSRKYPSSDWAKAFNTGLSWAMDQVEYAETVPAQYVPPNNPLTLDQLREMDGEPVWVERECGGQYRIIANCDKYFTNFEDGRYLLNNQYGKTWLAYRRKREEGDS